MCLTGWLLDRLAALRHGNGEPMARIYGPASTRDRGSTVAFNLLDPGGRIVDERAVGAGYRRRGDFDPYRVLLQPGRHRRRVQPDQGRLAQSAAGNSPHEDQYLDLLGMPSGGSLRASVGLASNVDDVERLVAFVELTYRDRAVGTAGLAPRRGC